MGYRRSFAIKRRERGLIGGEQMVVNFAGVEASHHSFVMRDVWYQESSKTNDKKCPRRWCGGWVKFEGDGGRRWRIEMVINGQGAYHWLIYCWMLLRLFAPSNRCGQ
ncbi:hypothetical protein GOBAR_AA29746 [Gossypium barbadense]|uniref:Uncharacterized protein n=1 Tax=Gossypium barbadense TaxID=3634 RepID=A0A2P5WIN0_GOSBA|nr:hypothetical protein GOBAR_AA29746 [Gossypium barbadense]